MKVSSSMGMSIGGGNRVSVSLDKSDSVGENDSVSVGGGMGVSRDGGSGVSVVSPASGVAVSTTETLDSVIWPVFELESSRATATLARSVDINSIIVRMGPRQFEPVLGISFLLLPSVQAKYFNVSTTVGANIDTVTGTMATSQTPVIIMFASSGARLYR